MWSVELMVATLRICNSACCLDKFVCLGLIDISATFRDVRDAVPYGNIGNVYFITVASDALVAHG